MRGMQSVRTFHQKDTSVLRYFDKLFRLSSVDTHWFLAEDMLAGFDGRETIRKVVAVWCAYAWYQHRPAR